MSLIAPAAENAIVTNAPRLHAFVIGVGDYPHLNGGTGTLAQDPLGLSQVTTPCHTVPKIVDWLLNKYNNPACPLGSVEVLVSPGAPVGGQAPAVVADSATMANIEKAFAAWEQRCSKQADNISFFYFCGHGVAKIGQYLLPEDFGDPQVPNQWKNCIDFGGLRDGMRKCKAQTQLFFVDACRETPFGLLTQLHVTGNPLITASFTDMVTCSSAYYATTQGRKAYGPDDEPTYFSRALLSCLNGVAAEKRKGKYVVDTYSLSNALGKAMAHNGRRYKQTLACNPDVSGLAVINEPGTQRVIAAIECSSDAASAVAEIMLSSNGAVLFQSARGKAKPLIEEVDAGDWIIDVRFPGGEYAPSPPLQETFVPPVFDGVQVP
jgi:hypothetical protein